MSVEAMTMVTISGPEKMVNTAIQSLVINKEFHPENAIKLLSGEKELVPFDTSNPYAGALAKLRDIAAILDFEHDFRDFSKTVPSLPDVSDYLNGLISRLTSIKDEREEKALIIKNNEVVCKQLEHFANFNVELSDLFAMKYLKFHFGRIPAETYKECLRKIDDRPDVYFVSSGKEANWVYGAYFALPEAYTQIESIFSSLGFERIRIDVKGNVENTAYEVIKRMKTEKTEATDRIRQINDELTSIKSSESEKILLNYSWLRYMSDSFDIISYAGRRHGKFYIIGWIPKEVSEDFVRECESIHGFACFLTSPKEMKETSPPVKLKKGFLSDIYQPFLEMYGLPAYGELDPRLFMAITYTVLFGIMFGDLGQGILLVVIGILLWKLKNVWLGRIIALCGLSASIFGGLVYGSVFGNEELLPWGLNFKVLEDDNTIKILMIAVVIGVGLITVSMIMNIMTGFRQKDIKKAFFAPNGVAGFVFYVGIAVGVLFQALMGKNVFTAPYIIGVIVLPLFLIFAGTPLTKLLTGQKDWMPESIGMFIVEGFFELFETLLSYVSNTVSFLRVGAFAISHAGMMMVVYLLSGESNIAGLIFGNLLVTGLETVLVCIQVMRLEFYEMFGRFYESGGVKFSPKIINYKVAE